MAQNAHDPDSRRQRSAPANSLATSNGTRSRGNELAVAVLQRGSTVGPRVLEDQTVGQSRVVRRQAAGAPDRPGTSIRPGRPSARSTTTTCRGDSMMTSCIPDRRPRPDASRPTSRPARSPRERPGTCWAPRAPASRVRRSRSPSCHRSATAGGVSALVASTERTGSNDSPRLAERNSSGRPARFSAMITQRSESEIFAKLAHATPGTS